MSIIKEYDEVNKIVNDDDAFKIAYEKEKKYIELGFKYAKCLKEKYK